MHRLLLCAAILLALPTAAGGQEPDASSQNDASQQNQEALELLKTFYRHEAELYKFTLDEAGTQKLTLEPTVMSWTGEDYKYAANTVGPFSGEVYVWTYEGRAIVAGGIGSLPLPEFRNVFHEFHALSQRAPQPTRVHSARSITWEPAGETPQPIPDAPKPASGDTPAARSRRLLQMRKMAQEFQGRTINPEGTATAKLRLLPAPLFRLDPETLKTGEHGVIDGALFVYIGEVGTDSEMLLYIECRKTDDGLEWTYVPAAVTYLEMWMEHKGKEVWHIPNYFEDPRQNNYFTTIAEQIASLEDIRDRLKDDSPREVEP
jgi:hypothetical protein